MFKIYFKKQSEGPAFVVSPECKPNMVLSLNQCRSFFFLNLDSGSRGEQQQHFWNVPAITSGIDTQEIAPCLAVIQ